MTCWRRAAGLFLAFSFRRGEGESSPLTGRPETSGRMPHQSPHRDGEGAGGWGHNAPTWRAGFCLFILRGGAIPGAPQMGRTRAELCEDCP